MQDINIDVSVYLVFTITMEEDNGNQGQTKEQEQFPSDAELYGIAHEIDLLMHYGRGKLAIQTNKPGQDVTTRWRKHLNLEKLDGEKPDTVQYVLTEDYINPEHPSKSPLDVNERITYTIAGDKISKEVSNPAVLPDPFAPEEAGAQHFPEIMPQERLHIQTALLDLAAMNINNQTAYATPDMFFLHLPQKLSKEVWQNLRVMPQSKPAI